MQVGDLVQVTGKVKDIVGGSVLVGVDPDGREYWFLEVNVSPQSQLTQAEQAAAAAAASTPTETAPPA